MNRKCISLQVMLLIGIFLLSLLLSSCESFGKFRKSESPDLTPFVDQTVAMAGDIYFSMAGIRTVYIGEYFDEPEVQELTGYGEDAVSFMKGIINYSMQVVTLSQSNKPGSEQAQALAQYLDDVMDISTSQREVPLTVSEKSVNDIIQDIEAQEDLLGALRAAQPLIDETGRVAGEFIDMYKNQFYVALDAMHAAVDREYEPVLTYQRTIRRQQDFMSELYNAIVEYSDPESTQHDELLEYFMEIAPTTIAFDQVTLEDGLTIQELWKIEDVLLERFARISQQRASTAPELEVYRNTKAELDEVLVRGDATIVKARAAVFVWVRVHRRMSEGIVNPAEINLWEVTKKIIDEAPLPF